MFLQRGDAGDTQPPTHLDSARLTSAAHGYADVERRAAEMLGTPRLTTTATATPLGDRGATATARGTLNRPASRCCSPASDRCAEVASERVPLPLTRRRPNGTARAVFQWPRRRTFDGSVSDQDLSATAQSENAHFAAAERVVEAPRHSDRRRSASEYAPDTSQPADALGIREAPLLDTRSIANAMSDFRARYHAVERRLGHPRSAGPPGA